MAEANTNLNIYVKLHDQASQGLSGLSDKVKSLQPQFRAMAIAGAAGLAAVTGIAIKSTNDFGEFEAQIQRAGANVGATADQLEIFRKVAKNAALETSVSATDAAHALFFLAGGSIDANEAAAALSDTIKFATANNISLEKATISAAQVMTLFKVKAEDVNSALDVMTKAGQVSFATMEQMTDALSDAAPIAARVGIKIEDLAALIGSLGEAGILGSEAGVALKRAFTELLNPTKQMEESLNALGLTSSQLQKQLNDPIAMLRTLEQAMEGITDPIQKAAALSQVFGQISGPAMASLLSVGTDAIEEMRNELNLAAGATEDAFKRIHEARTPMELLKSTMEVFSITVGQALMPALKKLVEAITPILVKVADWIGEHPKLTVFILASVAAISALLLGLGSLGIMVGGITTLISTFGPILGAIAIPIGLIGAAIFALAGVVALFITLWKNDWEQARAIWELFKMAISTAIDFIKGKFEDFKDWIHGIVDSIVSAVKKALAAVARLPGISQVIGAAKSAISTIGSILPFAEGGIVTRPTMGLVGEAGPEAIIPLNRMAGMGGITINIYGDVSGEELIEKVKVGLMRQLRMDSKIHI